MSDDVSVLAQDLEFKDHGFKQALLLSDSVKTWGVSELRLAWECVSGVMSQL